MATRENNVTVELGELTNSCFVIMPFAGAFNSVYERVIRPAVEEAGLACIRADEVYSKPQVTHDIWQQIRACRIILAELTGKNPNVLYELGLAHAIGKPVLIITRNEEDVPFDLKALRYLYYDIDDPFWGESLKRSITEMCKQSVEQPDFGTVFSGIRVPEDATFEDAPILSHRRTQKFDLTGVWEGSVTYHDGRPSDDWVLHLVNQDTILNGTAVITYGDEDELSVVQQTLTGESDQEVINLHGVSYSYLRRGESVGYDLDDLSGVVSSNGGEIKLDLKDEDHRDSLGTLLLNKQRIERSDEAETK